MSDGRNHTSIPRGITYLIILAGCLLAHISMAQKIGHVDFQVVGNAVKVSYNVVSCTEGETYDVRLLLGMDGKLAEIKRGLSGDMKDVACGSSNTITWDVLSDRDGLKGRIYFTVEIIRVNSPVIVESGPEEREEVRDRKKESKDWARKSWKGDKGWVGGSIGMFTPYESYSVTPYNLSQGGFFINASIGFLPTLLLGVTSTVYIYSPSRSNALDVKSWKNYGIMIGPLISLPIGNRVKWEMRPQVGYSAITVSSDLSRPDSLSTMRAGVACSIGTGLRLNIGKRTCQAPDRAPRARRPWTTAAPS